MEKKTYTTDVDIMLRSGSNVSGPVAGFTFGHTEDAIDFAGMVFAKLDTLTLTRDDVYGVTISHKMRDYVNVYVDVVGSLYFDEVWPVVVNACRVFQVFNTTATASNVVEFPYGY